jgi:hypothetical protein
MIPNNTENKKAVKIRIESAYLPASIQISTLEALNKRAKETGNRSLIVDRAIRNYLGLNDDFEQEAKAS